MVNIKSYRLTSPEFAKLLQVLCHKAKRRKKQQRKLPINWHGKENFEFDEYRNYHPGDDLRRVDWNIYQRLQEVVVKEYEIEPPQHLVVVLDISSSMSCYNKLSYAKALSALCVYIGATILDKVSFVTFPRDNKTPLQSFSNNKNMRSFLQYLEELSLQSSHAKLSDIFQSKILNSRHINTIVISDFYTDEYFSSLQKFRGVCTAVQVVTDEELHPKIQGNISFLDIETQKKISIIVNENKIKQYQQKFKNHLARVKNFCRQKKINYLLVNQLDINIVLNILQIAGIIR